MTSKSDKIAKWGLYGTFGFFGVLMFIGFVIDGFKSLFVILGYLGALLLITLMIGYLPRWLQPIAILIVGLPILYSILGSWILAVYMALIIITFFICTRNIKDKRTKDIVSITLGVLAFATYIFSDSI